MPGSPVCPAARAAGAARAARNRLIALTLLGWLVAACGSGSGAAGGAGAVEGTAARRAPSTTPSVGVSVPPAVAASRTTPRPPGPTSNVVRADYAGSAACAECHAEVAAAFDASPMHQMTRRVAGAALRAAFAGESLRLGADEVFLEGGHAAPQVRLVTTSPQGARGEQRFAVTKIVGGRHREDYVGRPLDAAGAPDLRQAERIMPVSYVFEPPALRYKGYSVMLPERDRLKPGAVWRQTCIFCHNTTPLLTTLYDDLLGASAPGYQGKLQDNLVPPARRQHLEVVDAAALERAVAAERAVLYRHTPPRPVEGLTATLRATVGDTRAGFDEDHLVEVGIGCESCHLGARHHAETLESVPDFLPRGAGLVSQVGAPTAAPDRPGAAQPSTPGAAPSPAQPTRAQAINRACARCHTVLFTGYGHTWEGGARADAMPGGSSVNSGEARDFLLGGCADDLACTDCHDPHGRDDPARLAAFDTPAGNATCLRCHSSLNTPQALQAHTRHDPAGPGSACAQCHLPRKNLSLTYRLTRYHRIGAPTDRARVEGDRPLECAVCHGDWSVARLVEAMETGWGRTFDRAALRRLYGPDLNVNVLAATLALGKPHEQVTAVALAGEQRRIEHGAAVAAVLGHPLPLLRFYAREALLALTGQRPDLDLHRPGAELVEAGARWWQQHAPPSEPPAP